MNLPNMDEPVNAMNGNNMHQNGLTKRKQKTTKPHIKLYQIFRFSLLQIKYIENGHD